MLQSEDLEELKTGYTSPCMQARADDLTTISSFIRIFKDGFMDVLFSAVTGVCVCVCMCASIANINFQRFVRMILFLVFIKGIYIYKTAVICQFCSKKK